MQGRHNWCELPHAQFTGSARNLLLYCHFYWFIKTLFKTNNSEPAGGQVKPGGSALGNGPEVPPWCLEGCFGVPLGFSRDSFVLEDHSGVVVHLGFGGFLVDCVGCCCPIAELCEAEYEQGPCRASIQRWYYNKETGICQTFYYGGCKGNKNNYMDENHCKSTCTGEVPGLVLPRDSRLQARLELMAHCLL